MICTIVYLEDENQKFVSVIKGSISLTDRAQMAADDEATVQGTPGWEHAKAVMSFVEIELAEGIDDAVLYNVMPPFCLNT